MPWKAGRRICWRLAGATLAPARRIAARSVFMIWRETFRNGQDLRMSMGSRLSVAQTFKTTTEISRGAS